MKKVLLFIAVLGLFATGCSNADDTLGNHEGNYAEDADVPTDYMAISICATGTAGSRADKAPGEYEDGSEAENAVEKIRFYFFTEDRKAAPVRKNPDKSAAQGKDVYDSFYDYDPMLDNEYGEGDKDLTIEKTITVSLMLNIHKGLTPKYVVAVLNPTADVLVDDPSVDDLAELAANFVPKNGDKFLMSNSVYATAAGAKINCTEINGLYKSLEEALDVKNRTIIYVERAAARLDLTIGQTPNSKIVLASTMEEYVGEDTENVFYTGEKYTLYDAPVGTEPQPIFVKFIGWTITSTPDKANLLKNINPEWDDTLFGTLPKEPWNAEAYYRSFWGINPELTNANNKTTTFVPEGADKAATNYQFFNYNDIASANTSFGNGATAETVYLQENAAVLAGDAVLEGHETKVIVAAKLVDKNGKDMPIVEYGFKYYEKEDLLSYFAAQLALHFHTADNTPLAKEDLTYRTQADYINDAGVKVPGGYFSYVALSDTGAKKDWYLDDDKENKVEIKDVNKYIQDKIDGRLLIWDKGQTYYYFTIRHLGAGTDDEPGTGYYGIVRNHIYKADISNLTGLGTPVLDPTETIYPEHPERDGNVLAAEIRVLSWRVVTQDYEFSW